MPKKLAVAVKAKPPKAPVQSVQNVLSYLRGEYVEVQKLVWNDEGVLVDIEFGAADPDLEALGAYMVDMHGGMTPTGEASWLTVAVVEEMIAIAELVFGAVAAAEWRETE
jgi:hypothetical protein